MVVLSAVPDAGSSFNGWRGEGCTGVEGCIVKMDAERHVTAGFEKIPEPEPEPVPVPVIPEPEPVLPPPAPLDSDLDGVFDPSDQCPGTPLGMKVDGRGCPLDSDGDGVIDELDQCPGTPLEVPVDEKGCPPEKVTIALTVEFDFDKWNIRKQYDEELDRVANFMKLYPNVTAEIEGHTDSFGSDAYNIRLSQRRAKSVVRALISRGVEGSRLTPVGYGERRPIATNADAEGRQRNRRVIGVFRGLTP